jgi:hypothetical protein
MADGEIKAIVTADIAPFEKKLEAAKVAADKFSADINKKLSGGTGEFVKSVKRDVDAIQKLLPEFKKLIKPLTDVSTKIRPIATAFGTLATNLDKVTASGTTAAKSLEAVAASVTKLATGLSNVSDRINAAATSTKKLSDANRELSKTSSRASKDVEKTGKKAEGAGKKFKESADRTKGFDRVLSGLADSAALTTGPLGGIASRITVIKRAMGAGTLSVVALSTALTGLGIAATLGVKENLKFETSLLRLKGVIRATGGAAGISAEEIRGFARELDLSTLGSALEIEEAAGKLLLFKGVAGDVFKSTLKVAQDFASIGIGTVTSNIQSLGAALQDPVAQVGRLERKFGVDFPVAAREAIEFLTAIGERAKAQTIVLGRLQDATDGTAQAMAEGLSGQLDTLSLRWSELIKQVDNSLGTFAVIQRTIRGTNRALEEMTEAARKIEAPTIDEQIESATKAYRRQVTVVEKLLALGVDDSRLRTQGDLLTISKVRLDALREEKEVQAQQAKEDAERLRRESKAEQERLDAESKANAERQRAQADQNRLNSLRDVSLRALREENDIITRMMMLDPERRETTKQLGDERERITRLVRLGLTEADENITKLNTEYNRLVAIGDEKSVQAAAAIKQRMENAKTLSELNHMLTVNKELSAIQAQDAQAVQRRDRFKEDRADIEVRIEAAQRQLALVDETTEAREAANIVIETELRLQKRLNDLTAQGQDINSIALATEREEIRLLVTKEQKLQAIEEATQEMESARKRAHEKELQFQESLASGFTDLVMSGENFKQVLAGIIGRLAEAILQAETLRAIKFSTGGDPGERMNPLGQLFGVVSKAFGGEATDSNVSGIQAHQGGTVGSMAKIRKIPTPVAINAPRFHNGLRQNEVPAILEKGEEVIPKDQVGRRERGSTNITFNVSTPDADSFRRSQRQLSRQARRAVS